MSFRVARSLEEVTEAWRLLYRAYLQAGFITPNPQRLHTAPQSVGPHAAVVLASIGEVTVSTITAIRDSERGLPLDSVYAAELDVMRQRGGKLLEIGLFGDRREIIGDPDRTFNAVFELMRFTFFFGYHHGVTDFLCGIPPRRARLYGRAFGFKPVGEIKSYATVDDNPVQLMHSTLDYTLANKDRHRALAYFFERPVPADAFADRFDFDPAALAGSDLGSYLARKQVAHKPSHRPIASYHPDTHAA